MATSRQLGASTADPITEKRSSPLNPFTNGRGNHNGQPGHHGPGLGQPHRGLRRPHLVDSNYPGSWPGHNTNNHDFPRRASSGRGAISSQQESGSRLRGHIVATIGEFFGTTAFLFFAFGGTQVGNAVSAGNNEAAPGSPDPNVLMYIALSFGFSLMVNAWVFYRISGGLFNPAVTLSMWLTGGINWFRAIILTLAQILGAILASGLVKALFPEPFNVNTSLSNSTSLARGFFIEAILTMELVFTILMLAKEKHKATFIAPVGIGLALFIAELVGVFYTGGSLNPARSFGPAVVSGQFDSDHWIYWIGPLTGAGGAVLLYKVVLLLNYNVGNPGQDEDSEEAAEAAAEEAILKDAEAAAAAEAANGKDAEAGQIV